MNDENSATRLRWALAREIRAAGSLTEDAWHAAVAHVPREAFLGRAVYRAGTDGDGVTVYEPLRRAELGEAAWTELACANETWVTQVDGIDADMADGPVRGLPTSSSTLPSLVARTLEAAGVRDGERVLEIGTGTGYSTALLCHRLGAADVASVEIDAGVAGRARAALHSLGLHPELVVGDGLDGYAAGAPYDRIVAACSVRTVPRPWLWQVRPGGTITFALGGWCQASGLVTLTVGEDGTAQGRFTGETVSYMLARPHTPPPYGSIHLHPGEARPTALDPRAVWGWTGRFLAQLAAPTAQLLGGEDRVILTDVATGSLAWTEPATGRAGRGWTVHQHGPLRLWDAVELAHATWRAAGEPSQDHFALTVTPTTQQVRLTTPDGPTWPLPA
jgi:methyltransferase of ATP-grasp peptide maturase system